MFLDDDIVFKKNSFVEMKKFIKKNERLYIGYGFNLINKINYKSMEMKRRVTIPLVNQVFKEMNY